MQRDILERKQSYDQLNIQMKQFKSFCEGNLSNNRIHETMNVAIMHTSPIHPRKVVESDLPDQAYTNSEATRPYQNMMSRQPAFSLSNPSSVFKKIPETNFARTNFNTEVRKTQPSGFKLTITGSKDDTLKKIQSKANGISSVFNAGAMSTSGSTGPNRQSMKSSSRVLRAISYANSAQKSKPQFVHSNQRML